MKLTELCIDVKRTFGDKLWVVDVTPAYEYKDGHRTENIQGYRYETVLPGHKMDKISVRIDGPALLEPPNGYYEVAYDGLEVFIYWTNGNYAVDAKATGVKVLKNNT